MCQTKLFLLRSEYVQFANTECQSRMRGCHLWAVHCCCVFAKCAGVGMMNDERTQTAMIR